MSIQSSLAPSWCEGRCDGRWRDVLLLRRRTGNGAISEGERDAGGQSAPPTQPCNFPGTIAAKRGSARSFHVPLRRGGPRWNGERASPSQVRERESSMATRLGMGWAGNGNGRRMKTTLQASKLATCRRTSTSTSSPTESVGGAASSFDHRAHGRRHTQKGTLTPVPALSTTSTAIFNPVQSGQNARGIHCE